jgi:hypothetical protein
MMRRNGETHGMILREQLTHARTVASENAIAAPLPTEYPTSASIPVRAAASLGLNITHAPRLEAMRESAITPALIACRAPMNSSTDTIHPRIRMIPSNAKTTAVRVNTISAAVSVTVISQAVRRSGASIASGTKSRSGKFLN